MEGFFEEGMLVFNIQAVYTLKPFVCKSGMKSNAKAKD